MGRLSLSDMMNVLNIRGVEKVRHSLHGVLNHQGEHNLYGKLIVMRKEHIYLMCVL
jgi:hypothetical protein